MLNSRYHNLDAFTYTVSVLNTGYKALLFTCAYIQDCTSCKSAVHLFTYLLISEICTVRCELTRTLVHVHTILYTEHTVYIQCRVHVYAVVLIKLSLVSILVCQVHVHIVNNLCPELT